MSTLAVAAVKSNSTSPPVFQNTNGTEVGTLCRAWVNFNGTGTVAIRASFNVSSITDNSAGDFTVNFAAAMPDLSYCAAVSCTTPAGYNTNGLTVLTNISSSSARIGVVGIVGTSNVAADSTQVNLAFFR